MKKTIIATLILTASASLSWAGATEGKAVFAAKCKACHGAEGIPPAGMAKAMGIKPMKDVQALTDAQMQEAVLKGKGKMKPVAGITEKQAADVVAFVRTLK
jgi:mono/diheme cytochrome c family protein